MIAPSDDAVPRALVNLRDVAESAGVRPGVLLRGDAPHPGDDAPALAPWPPRTVLDLRSGGEVGANGHPLSATGATVLHRPMMAAANPLKMAEDAERRAMTLPGMYRSLLRVAGPIVAELAVLVADGDGSVFVHCTAGKDRTGVTVGTLLAAVGVPRAAIVADYVRTDPNIGAITARMIEGVPEPERDELRELVLVHHADLMHAPAEAIESVLDALDAHPGGAAGWLAAQGVSTARSDALRARLLAG